MRVACEIVTEKLDGKSSYPGEPKFLTIKDSIYHDRIIVETPDGRTYEVRVAELQHAIRAANI